MEFGESGPVGQHAQCRVVVVSRVEEGLAAMQLHLAEGPPALDLEMVHNLATHKDAQLVIS